MYLSKQVPLWEICDSLYGLIHAICFTYLFFSSLSCWPIFSSQTGSINYSDESLNHTRKSSTSSGSSTSMSNHLSASNPDMSSVGLISDSGSDMPEHVVKVFRSDQTFKYLLIHKVSQVNISFLLMIFGLLLACDKSLQLSIQLIVTSTKYMFFCQHTWSNS